jgi:phosphinothricin acetyltransferase
VIIRDAAIDDLAAIVAIYNAAIPGRMATADLEPVSIASRRSWFGEHSPDAFLCGSPKSMGL